MIKSLPGFRVFHPEACSIRNYIFGKWRSTARSFGFSEYDAPVLEPLELFTAKSGDEIVKQLFHFEDQGGRKVAMRPEMTPSLARLVGAQGQSIKKPVKWFSIGEFFRYERPQKGRLRSFYQFNVDLLGEASISADAEVIALAVQSLLAFGLTEHDITLKLSDRDLWVFYLQAYDLSDEAIQNALTIVDKLDGDFSDEAFAKLEAIFKENTSTFWDELKALVNIHSIEGLVSFFKNTRAPKAIPAIDTRVEEWELLINTLHALGIKDCLRIDFSIVRGLAYYTGFVFEIFESSGKSRALAGGGRYDHLVKKLGGPDMPALGFAVGDVTLTDLLEEKGLLPEYSQSPDFFFVLESEEEKSIALEDARALRAQGYRVEYVLKPAGFNKQFKVVQQLGPKLVVIYGKEDLAAGNVKLLNPSTKEEIPFPQNHLQEAASAALEEGLSGLVE